MSTSRSRETPPPPDGPPASCRRLDEEETKMRSLIDQILEASAAR
ncbi:MAG: hypothetical protein ACYDH5_19055 [Acidimicrobiales bacterium]